jgi:DNA repair protein RadC
MLKMRQKYLGDRPREKLKARGAVALSNLELLQAIVGSGNAQVDVMAISRRLLEVVDEHGTNVDYGMLARVSGLGPTKICTILAAFELAKRYLQVPDCPVVDSPEAVVGLLGDIRGKSQEHLVLLTLDGANRLISRHTITIGTLTASLVHPREIFAPAIADRAAAIVLAHNHPSGDLTPSQADKETTFRIKEVALTVGIPLSDHIVVTKDGYRSIL